MRARFCEQVGISLKMISPSDLTWDESSAWDSNMKLLMDVPEDQLNIAVTNSPEWSISRHNNNTSRRERDTSENSQPTLLISSGETTQQTNTDTSYLKESEEKSCSERSEMEVDAQMPVPIPCLIDQIKNNEKNCEILVENNTVATNHTLNSPNKLNTSNDQPTLLTSHNKFPNCISSVNIKVPTVTTSDNISLCEKNVCNVIGNMPSKSCNPEVNETISELIKSGDLNTSGKNEPVLNIKKETINMDADITNENERVETNVYFQDMAEANKTYNQCSKSNGILKELSTSDVTGVSLNEPGIKTPCNSNVSKTDVENAQQSIIHKDVTGNKSVFAETLSVKRKLESKNRSLKKRRKQGEERSIKKACDVCYSVEHIKTMLNIMKQFI